MNPIQGYRSTGPIIPPDKVGKTESNQTVKHQQQTQKNQDFSEVLDKELDKIQFSKHAQNRIHSRNINIDQTKMDKLSEAVEKAESKGAKESLVVMDDTAFVVSVENRTVITAANGEQLKDNVFTNIDSAVIL